MWAIWVKEKGKLSKIIELNVLSEACKHADWFIEEGLYEAKDLYIMASEHYPKDQ